MRIIRGIIPHTTKRILLIIINSFFSFKSTEKLAFKRLQVYSSKPEKDIGHTGRIRFNRDLKGADNQVIH
jgi:hypothetical protein